MTQFKVKSAMKRNPYEFRFDLASHEHEDRNGGVYHTMRFGGLHAHPKEIAETMAELARASASARTEDAENLEEAAA